MLNFEKLPDEYITGNVRKIELPDLSTGQCLHVEPHSSILMHDHDGENWEAWYHLATNTVYICTKDEEHQLINDSSSLAIIWAIKGDEDYTYDELEYFFMQLGLTVRHGSVHLKD